MTEEELKQLKEFLAGKMAEQIETAKAAWMADLEGKFGTPDEEYRAEVEKAIGELDVQLKELMKPGKNEPAGAVGEDGDPWCGFKSGAEFLDR